MSAPEWLLPARSIPVWVGAWALLKDVHAPKGSPEWTRGLVTEMSEYGTSVDVPGLYGEGWADPGNIAPDLSNPDTFAAARDRLAQRMWPHCDKSAGVAFYLSSRHAAKQRWVLGTFPTGDDVNVTRDFPMPSGASRELALALAWQQVVGS